jgi:enoyl-CoA hydratase/carnithine racemase
MPAWKSLTHFDNYRNKYDRIRLTRDERGILLVEWHCDGGPLVWGADTHAQVTLCLGDIAADRDNQVVILTGSGGEFIGRRQAPASSKVSGGNWAEGLCHEAKRLLMNHLDIEAPMIAAINGPATVHAELGLLCDIVLAAEAATFQDQPHFPSGNLPGDGVHIVWPHLLGTVRGRYFLLTGQTLTARQACDWGIVNEVLPADRLLPRAYELAALILEKPKATRRLARQVISLELQRLMQSHLAHGLALEGLAAGESWN